MKLKHLPLFLFLVLISCNQNNRQNSAIENPVNTATGEERSDAASAFTKSIHLIYNQDSWIEKEAVSFDLDVDLNGEQLLEAKLTSQINSPRVRLDKNDGTKLVYNGEEIFLCPQDANANNAQFDVLSWQYLFTLPFRLADPGTKMEILEQKKMHNQILYRAKFTPSPNRGTFDGNEFILYQESETGLLYGAAFRFIKNPGAGGKESVNKIIGIIYREYEVIEGIPIATSWTFHNWSEQDGFGSQIGEAEIENITFFEAQNELFDKPENSRILE